jgi:hypothetical protein
MRHSRIDLVPVGAILCAGLLGVMVSAGFVLSSPIGEPPASVPAEWSSGTTGTWVVSVDLGRAGSGEARFVLHREGERITGTYRGAMGRDVQVEGSVTEGLVELSFESERGEVTYEGTLEGTTMVGTCVYGDMGRGTFEGRRRG